MKTKDEYKEVTNKSPMFGLDCEMCQTKAGSELTRISVVNENHEVNIDLDFSIVLLNLISFL